MFIINILHYKILISKIIMRIFYKSAIFLHSLQRRYLQKDNNQVDNTITW